MTEMAATTMKPISFYLDLQYPFKVTADEEGGYVIEFPDLPGCLTQVETAEEIGPMAEEARRLWITTEYEEGEEIPLPSYPVRYSGKFNVRLPRSLHRRLAELAEREGVSLNQCVVALLAQREMQASAKLGGPRERRSVNAKVAEGSVAQTPGQQGRVAANAGGPAASASSPRASPPARAPATLAPPAN
jgi:predicted RNase H-like HicB family nuclease